MPRALAMAAEVHGEQVGRCENVGVVEEHDRSARRRDAGVARRGAAAVRAGKMAHGRMPFPQLR